MKSFNLFLILFLPVNGLAQNVGIGTSSPSARLHVTDSSVLFSSIGNVPNQPGNPPIEGPGRRMMWYADKAAFRAGYVSNNNWDKDSIGTYSFAAGYNSKAKAFASVALGYFCYANEYSTAIGLVSLAGGFSSTAIGSGNAGGDHAIAIGYESSAAGYHALAIGNQNDASGFYATAIGDKSIGSGIGSVAMGTRATASGDTSTALGYNTEAGGTYSTAMGYNTKAYGFSSTTMGYNSIANGVVGTAIGLNGRADGYASVSLGNSTNASGDSAVAFGSRTLASGINATAIGNSTIASGDFSIAAGRRVSTNLKTGAFFFGDSDPNNKGVRLIGFNNQFATRFNGGYYFISSDAGADIGVQVLPGGNAWVAMCDENRKENFEPLDGEHILQKIKEMKFSSWNYKTQDPTKHRHYGIMAQDFYKAFGNDKYGKIGNDSTVNPIDMIGIDMAAIQALEKRTAQLTEENMLLKNEMNELKRRLDRIEKEK